MNAPKCKVYPTYKNSLHYPGEPTRFVPEEGDVVFVDGYWNLMRQRKKCRICSEDHTLVANKPAGDDPVKVDEGNPVLPEDFLGRSYKGKKK